MAEWLDCGLEPVPEAEGRRLAGEVPALAEQPLDAMAEIVVKEQALRERAGHEAAGGRLS